VVKVAVRHYVLFHICWPGIYTGNVVIFFAFG